MLGHLLSDEPWSALLKYILEVGGSLDSGVDQKYVDARPEDDFVRGCQMLIRLLQFSREVLHMFDTRTGRA